MTARTLPPVNAPPVPAAVRHDYRRRGFVTDQTVTTLASRAARRWPERPAVIEGGRVITHRELLRLVEQIGGWLSAQGVGAGHAVCWQSPNWWEAHVVSLAIWHVGAVSVPLAPIYREHELRHVIALTQPAAVVTTPTYRGFDHADAFDTILSESGGAEVARLMLRGTRPGWTSFAELAAGDARCTAAQVQADDPCLVLFTSGTTAAAKGAVHSSTSLLAETRQLVDAWRIGCDDVSYMPAPLQHITGLLNAITIPALSGACSVLAERWAPDRAVMDMQRHQVTWTAGATVFLEELSAAAEAARTRLALQTFVCGGAPVARPVMERAEAQGIPAVRVYGMTELPTVTVMDGSAPFDLRADTDGALAPGVEARIVPDADDGPTTEGEIVVRGPERMLGYLVDAENVAALDAEGWFATGDLGRLDAAGHVTVTGRTKDVINRGGEKFSAREIEDLLLRHPDVREAAVVAAPDERFGEVPVAFVVLAGGRTGGAPALAHHLQQQGLARQKTPVDWHVRGDLPRTPSGKVKKFVLVDEIARRRKQGGRDG
ncbi:MAG TPA: AMP-binding protein [Mycobacteriales bacterium]|nr:AMP-binding protein [Mycobacteriales bacterium]